MTRRQLIQLFAAAPAGAFFSGRLAIRAVGRPNATGLAHGLLFGSDDVPRIRGLYLEHPFFGDVRNDIEAMDRHRERQWMESEVRLNDQLTDISRLSRNAESMSLHYLLTGDEDAAQLAIYSVRTIMKFARWDFFVDGPHPIGVQRAPAATIAVALASDWLGDALTPDERRSWLSTMAIRGCEACYRGLYGIRHPREVIGWAFDPASTILTERPGNYTDMNRRPEITRSTNLRAIPACGLLFGAAVYKDVFGADEDFQRWLEMGVFTVNEFGEIYRADGSYDEGVSYANYTSEHITQAATVLARKEGIDLSDTINWDGYVDYITNMSMATASDPYDVVNFGDNGNAKVLENGEIVRVTRTAVPLWIARNRNSRRSQWFAKNLGGRADIRSLIFHDDAVAEQAPESGPQLWECELDWVVARTGFAADDLVVAMRSGGPANHEHADRNSMIVKCFGEQLVTDPYRPPYSFADPAWRMRLTEGHSAILIDGRGHEHHNGVEGTNASQSWARIRSSEGNSQYATWMSDASQPYRLVDLNIASVVRTVFVAYDVPAVVLIDRVTKREDRSLVEARFFGFNWDGKLEQHPRADGFAVVRPNAVLHATCYCNNGLRIDVDRLPISEERAARHPFVRVATERLATETLLVTAMTIGRSPASTDALVIDETDNGVHVRGRGVNLGVSRDGSMSIL